MVKNTIKDKCKKSIEILIAGLVGGFFGVYLNTFFIIKVSFWMKIISLLSVAFLTFSLVFLLLNLPNIIKKFKR